MQLFDHGNAPCRMHCSLYDWSGHLVFSWGSHYNCVNCLCFYIPTPPLVGYLLQTSKLINHTIISHLLATEALLMTNYLTNIVSFPCHRDLSWLLSSIKTFGESYSYLGDFGKCSSGWFHYSWTRWLWWIYQKMQSLTNRMNLRI